MKNTPNMNTLSKMAVEIHRHGNVRSGNGRISFYIGPNISMYTKTKWEMYYYLLGKSGVTPDLNKLRK